MSTPKIVKRYANRKLYDTERSCYVTLDDIAGMIKAGDEVRVVDNKTGEDLTTVTFAQIIFEAEKKENFMPLSLLRDLIRDSGDTISEFAREQAERVQARASEIKETAEKLRKDTRETADRIRHDLKDRIETVIGRKGDGEIVDVAKPKLIADLVKSSQKAFEDLQKGVEDRLKDGVGAVSRYTHLDKEMDEISKRLAALEQRLEKMS
jgi:polyhydroxyalkanoate synthesis repressor PhaR